MIDVGNLKVDESIRGRITDALDVIRTHAPDTYKKMTDQHWQLYLSGNGPGPDGDGGNNTVVFGATAEAWPEARIVAVDFGSLAEEYANYAARGYRLTKAEHLAYILVHEFEHLQPGGDQTEEQSVYATLAFAKATGNSHAEKIAEWYESLLGSDGWWNPLAVFFAELQDADAA